MNTNPTPLDLDAIRARSDARRDYADERPESLHVPEDYAALADESAADVPGLVAEVERLRAESQRFYENRNLWQKRAEKAEAERDVARAEVARLTARPAPAWDEDAVVEDMARAVYPLLFEDDRQPLRVFGEARSDAELREGERDVARVRMRQALAVVRDHQPVKPDREAVARAIFEAGAAGAAVEFGLDGPVPWSSLDVDDVERMCAQADAVLDLWPGRSEAEVKAEALNEAADSLERLDGENLLRGLIARIRARADRLAAEGGDDRG